jgi:hypothetical protein
MRLTRISAALRRRLRVRMAPIWKREPLRAVFTVADYRSNQVRAYELGV